MGFGTYSVTEFPGVVLYHGDSCKKVTSVVLFHKESMLNTSWIP